MSARRRICISLLLVCLCLALCLPSVAAIPSGYWPIQAAYIAALDAGDDDALLAAVERLGKLYAEPSEAAHHNQLAFPMLEAAKIYEERGNFPAAAACYDRALTSLRWLNENGTDYYDLIVLTEALYRHCTRPTEVYALSSTQAVRYDDALHVPEAGTYFGGCGSFAEGKQSAYLLYVHFYNETIRDFAWMLPKGDDYLLEVAWNMPNESLDDLTRVTADAAQDYIIENLKYLATLNVPVLLRFGAEVNCWPSLSGDKGEAGDAQRKQFMDAYIAAFRHVAALADEYAPEVAMVYAPLDVSNWYVSPLDFYPGDDVVDWVSVTSYQNRSSNTVGTAGSGNDAYYNVGLYDDQLTKIAPFVEAFGDRKPMLIGECGYCYRGADGLQTEEYAAEKLAHFYTYINMLYPQIKAVLYFDTDIGQNCFSLDGSETVKAAYTAAVEANAPMQATLTGEPAGYRPLDGFDEAAESLTLFTYASFPTEAAVTVSYALNGETLESSTDVPYTCTIPRTELMTGDTIEVTVTCAETVVERVYWVTVEKETVRVSTEKPAPETTAAVQN